jgi:hypothetical protein
VASLKLVTDPSTPATFVDLWAKGRSGSTPRPPASRRNRHDRPTDRPTDRPSTTIRLLVVADAGAVRSSCLLYITHVIEHWRANCLSRP